MIYNNVLSRLSFMLSYFQQWRCTRNVSCKPQCVTVPFSWMLAPHLACLSYNTPPPSLFFNWKAITIIKIDRPRSLVWLCAGRATSSYRGVSEKQGGNDADLSVSCKLLLAVMSFTRIPYPSFFNISSVWSHCHNFFFSCSPVFRSISSVGGGGGGYMQHNVFLYTKVGRHMCVWANSKNTCQHPMMGLMSDF